MSGSSAGEGATQSSSGHCSQMQWGNGYKTPSKHLRGRQPHWGDLRQSRQAGWKGTEKMTASPVQICVHLLKVCQTSYAMGSKGIRSNISRGIKTRPYFDMLPSKVPAFFTLASFPCRRPPVLPPVLCRHKYPCTHGKNHSEVSLSRGLQWIHAAGCLPFLHARLLGSVRRCTAERAEGWHGGYGEWPGFPQLQCQLQHKANIKRLFCSSCTSPLHNSFAVHRYMRRM